jgi:hypothetical protein
MHSHAHIARHLGALYGVIGVLNCLPIVSQVTDRPSKRIFGIYGQLTPGHDSIRVTENANDKISVALKLYYSNGHTCQINQDGEWRVDHVAIVADGLDANRQCKLSLFFKNGRVVLKDEGLQCAPVYCGARGKLDNVSLPKSSSDRK